MSAIAGFFHRNLAPADRNWAGAMLDVLSHRGHAQIDVWSEGPAALGQGLRWAVPSSCDKASANAGGRKLFAVAESRLEDRDKLCAGLGLNPADEETYSDSLLILKAYEKWGEECPARLAGDFSFALYDADRRTIFCARDHFGVKPLFYYLDSQFFAFGSEVKAILSLKCVPKVFDNDKISEFFISQYLGTDKTFYANVRRILPGHSIKVTPEESQSRCYYALDPTRDLKLNRMEEYTEIFHDLFFKAVRKRLAGDHTMGSFLSGGLDSSTIACVARNLLVQDGKGPLHTYSAVFDKCPECDERFYIQSVLNQNNVQSTYLHVDRLSPFDRLDALCWHLDQPHMAYNLFISMSIFEAARNQGIDILLEGFDGDTTISHGEGYLNDLAKSWSYTRLIPELLGYKKNHDLPFWNSLLFLIWHHNIRPNLPNGVLTGIRKLRHGANSKEPGPAMPRWYKHLNPDFMNRTQILERWRAGRHPRFRPRRQRHYDRLKAASQEEAFEIHDHAAAMFSVDIRYPFWDRSLVEFCLSLPPECIVERGLTRMIMRRAMTGVLPEEIRQRPQKSDLSSNFIYVLTHHGKDMIENSIENGRDILENYVNLGELQRIRKSYPASKIKDEEYTLLFKCVSFVHWFNLQNKIYSLG